MKQRRLVYPKVNKSLQITSAGEGVEKRECSYTPAENVNWCSQYGKQYGASSKKKKTTLELPYDPAIPLLGMHLVAQLCWTLCDPRNCMQLTRLLCPWGFSRQEYWSGLPCPPPGDLCNSGFKLRSPASQANSLPSETPGKPIPGFISGQN